MSEPSSDADEAPVSEKVGILRSIGPAIITASVVLGPGSILTASKVGCDFGYGMIWVLMGACLLMMAMTALSARLGVTLEGTLCEELAQRLGRPVAAVAGISIFLIATCFQFGNNLGVLAAIKPFAEKPVTKVSTSTTHRDSEEAPKEAAGTPEFEFGWPTVVLVLLNAVIIAALFGLRKLYLPLEKLMMLMVGLMLLAFLGNLLLVRPPILDLAGGLIPRLPQGAIRNMIPSREGGYNPIAAVVGLVATTLSFGGAFYQSYLVRQKGWKIRDLRRGQVDSAVGISVLAFISLMIMVTAAAVFHGQATGADLKSLDQVAGQLEPLFGPWAKVLFCLGIFAGAFSSFLVNAMIGGSLLADGLGLGGDMDQPWPKRFTVLSLLVGMAVAIFVAATGKSPVNLIIFAQALTVLGVPVLAGAMIYLATRPELTGPRAVPAWLKAAGVFSLILVLFLAARTLFSVYLRLT